MKTVFVHLIIILHSRKNVNKNLFYSVFIFHKIWLDFYKIICYYIIG